MNEQPPPTHTVNVFMSSCVHWPWRVWQMLFHWKYPLFFTPLWEINCQWKYGLMSLSSALSNCVTGLFFPCQYHAVFVIVPLCCFKVRYSVACCTALFCLDGYSELFGSSESTVCAYVFSDCLLYVCEERHWYFHVSNFEFIYLSYTYIYVTLRNMLILPVYFWFLSISTHVYLVPSNLIVTSGFCVSRKLKLKQPFQLMT